jgi:hypothetical protein
VNLSERGIYFATDSLLRKGETVEVFFNMPEEIIGEPTSGDAPATWYEWRRSTPLAGSRGVGVQFDCYEVSRSKPVDVATGSRMPVRMMSDRRPKGDITLPWKNERLLWTMNQPHAS